MEVTNGTSNEFHISKIQTKIILKLNLKKSSAQFSSFSIGAQFKTSKTLSKHEKLIKVYPYYLLSSFDVILEHLENHLYLNSSKNPKGNISLQSSIDAYYKSISASIFKFHFSLNLILVNAKYLSNFDFYGEKLNKIKKYLKKLEKNVVLSKKQLEKLAILLFGSTQYLSVKIKLELLRICMILSINYKTIFLKTKNIFKKQHRD
uniref:Uncharacterized protein n=1 Tax=Heterorhabditis bacteriophora TaxID=37862 RepID=A0A1I7WAU8_HETBA